MKRPLQYRLCLLIAGLLPLDLRTVQAQGIISFSNRNLSDPNGQTYQAPVTLPSGQGAGPGFTAGLFLIQGGNIDLLGTTSFHSGAASAYLQGVPITVPGVPAGSPATFLARVWDATAGSYEGAIAAKKYHGEFPTISGDDRITVTLGYNIPEAGLAFTDGLLPLTLTNTPEPSTISLAFMAGIIWLGLRRKSEIRATMTWAISAKSARG
jgi:hypothetical protein